MGDQWELDAEDQMGDTLCICGKVFIYSKLCSSIVLCPLLSCKLREVPAITSLQTVCSHPIACSPGV